jgi:hypothetical protein
VQLLLRLRLQECVQVRMIWCLRVLLRFHKVAAKSLLMYAVTRIIARVQRAS